MWAPGTSYVYSNPYYVQPTTYVDPVLSYAEPIAVPATAAAPVEEPLPEEEEYAQAPEATPQETAAGKRLDQARAAFMRGDYKRALAEVEQAIRLVPDDPTLHEFRALCFFALKDYRQAAAALYAVLSRGPGWNWDTMIALYPSQDVYTAQLRALENFERQNPQDPAAPFVLAYHYLVLEDFEAAKYQLQQAVRLSPDNKLAADLLRALEQAPPPGAEASSAAGEPS
jgi:tetratricopeptide (TPR) repeat protein